MKLMSILILLFAFAIGYATFIENDFGRSTSKALIFSKWWFEGILILLTYNMINNLIKRKLFRLDKIAALTFHLAFICFQSFSCFHQVQLVQKQTGLHNLILESQK